jgi:hypothetical protein
MPENTYLAALTVLEPLLPAKLFNEAARALLPALLQSADPDTRPPVSPTRAGASNRKRTVSGRRHRRRSRNAKPAANGDAGAPRGDRVEAAASFLREKLASGPTNAPALETAAKKQGISRNALARARRALAVVVSTPKQHRRPGRCPQAELDLRIPSPGRGRHSRYPTPARGRH